MCLCEYDPSHDQAYRQQRERRVLKREFVFHNLHHRKQVVRESLSYDVQSLEMLRLLE